MRFMAWHVEYFKAVPTERGRSKISEEASPIDAGEALLVFESFEKADEQRSDIVEKSADAIAEIAKSVGATTIVLNPFAHMFADLSSPEFAQSATIRLAGALSGSFDVKKLSFGWFYEIELKAKGHRLARQSRIV
ncbi:MAG: threonyl-tRNA synthetase editing domain-containing protein [Candidatus Micrarchaeaceae archaeon]